MEVFETISYNQRPPATPGAKPTGNLKAALVNEIYPPMGPDFDRAAQATSDKCFSQKLPR